MKKDTAISPLLFKKLAGQKKQVFIWIGVLIAIIYVAINIGIHLFGRTVALSGQNRAKKGASQPSGPTSPTLTPTPRPLLSKGLYKFSVSTEEGKLGIVLKGNLNPVDPPYGGKQDLEVTTPDGAENMSVTVITDTKKNTVSMTKDPAKPNVWTASWTMDDTYSYVYTVEVNGVVGGKSDSLPIHFR